MEQIRFIDLFGGIGGFRLGLERVNEQVGKEIFKCVWYNDIDKFSTSVYNYNFGEMYTSQNIRDVNPKDIPKFNMLCAGYPCQSWSIAGKKRGFNDERGTLFYEITRVCEETHPKILLLENVKGLLSHHNGVSFENMMMTLSKDLGYSIDFTLLNTKNFDIPQNRERVYILGILNKEPEEIVFDKKDTTLNIVRRKIINNKDIKMWNSPLQDIKRKENNNFTSLKTILQLENVIDNKYKLSNERIKELKMYPVRKQKNSGIIVTHRIEGRTPSGISKQNDRVYSIDGLSPCLTSSFNKEVVNLNKLWRGITPIECERLQGFPDNWTKYGKYNNGNNIEISDNQRYKQLGNAVNTKMINIIGKSLYNIL